MSILRPEDVTQARIEHLIARVQTAILNDYAPGLTIQVTIKRNIPLETLTEVVNAFRAAKWNVAVIDRTGTGIGRTTARHFCINDVHADPRPKLAQYQESEDVVVL